MAAGQPETRLEPFMGRTFSGLALLQAMAAAGLPIPENCARAEIVLLPDSLVTIRYEVYLEAGDIPKLIAALQSLEPQRSGT